VPILFDDGELVVVAKPAGVLVVPAPGRGGPTLGDLVGRQLGTRVFAVHRLDEDTTGVLALARTEAARVELEAVFRSHAAERIYVALVGRMPSPPAGRITSRLRVGADGVTRSVRDGRGDRAVTEYRALERRRGGVLVLCRLETGRRNQIRAHLAELGCPIVGDRKYGWRSRPGEPKPARPLLHAWRLRLPWRGAVVEIEAEPPEAELAVPPGAAAE